MVLPEAGLQGRYFADSRWTDLRRTTLDPSISTKQLSRGWGFTPPDVFTVRWSGFLHIDRAGEYRFSLTSDDGARLLVDRRVVIDNGGAHGGPGKTAALRLEPGRHAVVLEYAQDGGAYSIEWTWGPEGSALGPVPVWRLSPHPSRTPLLILQATAKAIWPWASLLVVLAGIRVLVAGVRAVRPRSAPDVDELSADWVPAWGGRQAMLCAAAFTILAVVHTWPLATAPSALSRNDNADTMLNEWTIAWIAHQLPRHPLALFDANIFFPETGALGFSEALVLPGAAAAPLLWAGASPVLAYNLLLLAGFILTGWIAALVVSKWTGSWLAGLTSGTLIAFNAHTLTRLPHLQAQHSELLLVALLSLDALLRKPDRRKAAWLGAVLALQAAFSVYLFVFTIVALIVGTAVRPEDWWGDRFRSAAAWLAAAAAMAAIVSIPLLWPYWELRRRGLVRTLDEGAWFAASLRDYLTTPSRWYPWAGGDVALYPGLASLLLALVAMSALIAFRDRRARMCLAMAVAGVTLSFGPSALPGYETLYDWFPPMQAVRTTSRFGYLGIAGMAVLAGYGAAELQRRVKEDRFARRAVGAGILGAVMLEPLAAPIEYQRFDGIPAIYRLAASADSGIVAELPLPRPESVYLNAQYMLNSTVHWRPMLNGYSGLTPASYYEHFDAVRDFPSETSIDALRKAGVTEVFVHFDELDAGERGALTARPELHAIAEAGGIGLFRLDPRG